MAEVGVELRGTLLVTSRQLYEGFPVLAYLEAELLSLFVSMFAGE